MRSKVWGSGAVLVLLSASQGWAMGGAMPAASVNDGPLPVVTHCTYTDAKGQDTTSYTTESECTAVHAQCEPSCYTSSYACVAQGVQKSGAPGMETGFSEISEVDARSRATTFCTAAGIQNCQVNQCVESRQSTTAPLLVE